MTLAHYGLMDGLCVITLYKFTFDIDIWQPKAGLKQSHWAYRRDDEQTDRQTADILRRQRHPRYA